MSIDDLKRLKKGVIYHRYRGELVDKIPFQFNPTTWSRELAVERFYTEHVGQYLPATQFIQFAPQKVTFELFLYSREGEIDMDQLLAKLELLVSPGPEMNLDNTKFMSNGSAVLSLGDFVTEVQIDSMNFSHEFFDRNFNPTRTRVSLEMTPISRGRTHETGVVNNLRRRAGVYSSPVTRSNIDG